MYWKKLCLLEKALCTGKSSVYWKKLCARQKALCTAESSVHGRKLCAQEKALCTGKSSVHRKKLCACARHGKKLCATKHGIGGPGGLPWSPQGRGEGLRERGKLRVEKVGFPSPFCLTTLQKVEFALLFQKPIQDPSTRLRLGRDDRLWPPKLCARNHSGKKGQGLPKNKEKLQTVPFLPVQGRLIVLLFIVFLHYHTAVVAPKP